MAGMKDVKNSKFLTKEDFPEPRELTVKGHTKENVARDNEPQKIKVIMYFEEMTKGVSLNVTNSRAILSICGLPPTADFIECNGHKVTVYNDPNIMMGDEVVGGIRFYVKPIEIAGLPGGNPNTNPQQPSQGVPGQVYPPAGQNVGNPEHKATIANAVNNNIPNNSVNGNQPPSREEMGEPNF